MSEFSFSSLMDLATLDTSDLSAQTSRLQREGIYVIELESVKFAEQASSDPAKPTNYTLGIKGNILVFAPLDPNAPAADLEGKTLNERYFLFGEQLQEAIQQLMGRYKIAGFKHKGVLGGVEGSAPGWIDEAEGKRVAVRVRHYTGKDGQERASFDWMTPKAMEKAGLNWDMMGRDFLNEVGEPIAVAA